MLACKQTRAIGWAIAAVLLHAATCFGATPRDELLRYVPADTGFCLVVQNLRGHLANLLASPFAREWSKSTFGASILESDEWKQIAKVDRFLSKHLGIAAADLRDDLFGEAFVFAYRPGPTGKPDQEQGLFLLRARNAKTLATLVQKINDLQKSSGELTGLVEREHKGVKYTCRVEKRKSYYLLRGPVLLFSGQEEFLQDAIERDKALAEDAVPPLARQLADLGLDRALAALTINPRSFDGAITAKAAIDPGTKAFATVWKAVQAIGLGVHLQRDLRLSLAIKARAAQLPAPARRFLESAGKASEVWSSFPDDALFATAGRLDLAALYDLLGEFVKQASKESMAAGLARSIGAVLGKDVLKEVLPAIGPDWGMCILAPQSSGPANAARSWAPRALFALRVSAGDTNDPVDQALLTALHGWAQMVVLGHNTQHPDQTMSLRTLMQDKVKVRYLLGDNAFPPRIKPAFALKAGYLVLATSPAEVSRFKVAPLARKDGQVPLMRIGVKELRAYLKDHAGALAEVMARKEDITREAARKKINGFRSSLELIDKIELSQKWTPGQFTLTLAVQTPQPLTK